MKVLIFPPCVGVVGLSEKVSSKIDNKMSIDLESSEKSNGGVSRISTTVEKPIKKTSKVLTYADVVRTKL